MTFFVNGRPKSAQQLRDSTVAACRAQSVTAPSSRATRECRSPGLRSPPSGSEKGVLLEKGSFQKSPVSRVFREFRGSRDRRELPDCGKQRRIRPFSRGSREFRDFRDSRDSSSEKTPFVMTPFSGPDPLKMPDKRISRKVSCANS